MRRTSICLAIVALLLCGGAYGQVMQQPFQLTAQQLSQPAGEQIMPGSAVPVPQPTQPVPPAPSATGTPSAGIPAAAAPPAPLANGQGVAVPQQNQPLEALQGDPNMMQQQATGQNVWNQAMPGMPGCQSCVYPGCALCGAGTGCPKEWYFDQRLRIMTHPRPRHTIFSTLHSTQVVPTTSGNVTVDVYTPATTSSSTPFDLSSSYEFTVGRYLGLDTYNRDHFLEFTFYGTNSWSSHAAVRSTANESGILEVDDTDPENPVVERWGVFGNINGGPSRVAGFNRADRQSSDYSSWLNDFEINLWIKPRPKADRLVLHKNGKWRRQCQQGIICNWMAGARLFSMGEKYWFHSESHIDYYHEADPDNPFGDSVSWGDYRTRTYNTLLGFQVGPDFTYRKCRLETGIGLKAGAFINFAKQETWINVNGAQYDQFSDGENIDFESTEEKNASAALFELDFHAAYKVRPNFILKANYEILYMAGLALAPEQVNMALDRSMFVGTGGHLWFQSATFGAEIIW